jgi:hypothetical protein
MAQRHDDALFIQAGACNPSGVARALVKAIDEARAEGTEVRADPAVRLICHQLAFLLNIYAIDNEVDEYGKCTDQCARLATRGTLISLKIERPA